MVDATWDFPRAWCIYTTSMTHLGLGHCPRRRGFCQDPPPASMVRPGHIAQGLYWKEIPRLGTRWLNTNAYQRMFQFLLGFRIGPCSLFDWQARRIVVWKAAPGAVVIWWCEWQDLGDQRSRKIGITVERGRAATFFVRISLKKSWPFACGADPSESVKGVLIQCG